jgi:hypothetical protein
MDDFVIDYIYSVENDELDAQTVNYIQQESYLYSMREKMNELLNIE